MHPFTYIVISTLIMALTFLDAAAQNLAVDQEKSRIEFRFSQMGVAMKGSFTRFDAKVFFNEKNPELTKAEFGVDINSVDLGDEAYNNEVKSPVWLNARMFPRANFVVEKVVPLGKNRFEAVGKLAIKGVSQPIKAQFTFTDGASPVVEGSFPMKRLGWGIGDDEWRDPSVVADEMSVHFRFVTRRLKTK